VAAAATHDPDSGQVALFVTNRADTETVVELRHDAFQSWTVTSARGMAADDEGPLEGPAAAEQARLADIGEVRTDGGTTTLRLPAESWTTVLVDASGSGSTA
jgi:alpha-N-arabinofuranosidase